MVSSSTIDCLCVVLLYVVLYWRVCVFRAPARLSFLCGEGWESGNFVLFRLPLPGILPSAHGWVMHLRAPEGGGREGLPPFSPSVETLALRGPGGGRDPLNPPLRLCHLGPSGSLRSLAIQCCFVPFCLSLSLCLVSVWLRTSEIKQSFYSLSRR